MTRPPLPQFAYCPGFRRSFLVLCGFLSLSLLVTPVQAQSWNLAWSDEFNGASNSAISATNWQYDTGILNVNNEVEYYCAPGSGTTPCDASTPNAYIDGNGHLVIQALRVTSSVDPYSGSWTSARLNSGNNLQSFQYGRIESSMSLPIGPGLWPAFWALGTNLPSVGWPASGEIDYMENVPASGGLGPSAIRSTLHGGTASNNCYCGGNGLGQSYTIPSSDPNGPDVTSFHTYGAIWSPNMVQFYVDDPANIFFVRTASDVPTGFSWAFNHPFFLLLNLAVGGTGSWPGAPDSTTPSPAQMLVDYVRVYQPSAVVAPLMEATPITVTAGQTGQSTVSLTSQAGNGRVYFSCSTNAPKSTCSVQSADTLNQHTVDFSTTAAGTLTVSLATTANTPARGWAALAGIVVTACFVIPVSARRRSARAVFVVLLGIGFVAGCGSSSSGNTGGGSNGTPSGSYTVTLSAFTVSNSTANPDATLNVPLTVN